MKYIFLSFLLLGFSISLFAQELIYDISMSGRKMGSMIVTKKQVSAQEVYYSAITDVQYTLFRKTDLVYFYEAVFNGTLLKKAYFIYKKNGALEEESKLLWTDQGYRSTISLKHLKYTEPFKKSMLCMYFQPPQHREEIFSERFHDFVKVGATEEIGKFIFYVPNGDKSIYYYNKKGICEKISITSSLLSFDMVLNTSGED